MLELIKPKTDYIYKYTELFRKNLELYSNKTKDKEIFKKIAFYGVKAINKLMALEEYKDYEETIDILYLIESVKLAMSLLTPNELITVFPIEKRYDGDKYKIKDYFYTMKELQKIGMNNMIKENIEELLWNYENMEVRKFLANQLNLLSDLNRFEIGESIMEKWAKENDIATYEEYTDYYTGKKCLYNTKTGKEVEIKTSIPKYLKVIK